MCYLMGHLSEFGLVFSLQFAWRFVDLLVVQYRMHVGLESHELGGVTAVITTWISKRENVMRALMVANNEGEPRELLLDDWPAKVFVVLGVCGGVGGCWPEGVDKVLKVAADESLALAVCPSAAFE